MKPAAFDYECAESAAHAVSLLHANAGEAKLLAGGQSLMPMINFRVVRPALLVDIGRLVELDFVRPGEGCLQVGALTRHRTLETSAAVARRFPVIPAAMKHVAHLAIRNRGTIGGSLAHADPATELPMLALLLDATIVTRAPLGGRRLAARDFFLGALTSALGEDEIVVQVDLPDLPAHTGWGFEEQSRRLGDFALACVGVLLTVEDGAVRAARVAMMGVGATPLRSAAAEGAMLGKPLDETLIEEVALLASERLEPPSDLHASPELRRHLARVLARRALRAAWTRALETTT